MSRRIGVLVNPASGRGRVTRSEASVLNGLGSCGDHVIALEGDSAEHADQLVRQAIADGLDILVAVGGDGTVNLALQAVVGTDTALGILPLGTGNDAAASVGIPKDPGAAVQTVLTGNARTFDVGHVETADGTRRHFLCVLSCGFDSMVNERANQMTRPAGDSRYIVAMLAELRRFQPIPYRAVIDGTLVEDDGMLISLANGPMFGGGMRVAPDADLHDGKLTMIWVHRMSRTRLLRLFPSIYSGSHIKYPQVEQRQVGAVHLEGTGQVAYADGERVGHLPVDVTTLSGGVRIIVPSSAPSA